MRNAWLAALVGFCFVTGGWILVHGRAGRGESAFAAALAEQAEAALGEASEAEPSSEAEGEPASFYRYTDESGSMHFVGSLVEVPKHLRGRARPVSHDRVQRAPTAPRPAPRSRPARPAPEEHRPARAMEHVVVVYTTSWCGWCRKTLAFLDQQDVDYENRDIEAHDEWREELEAKTGSTSIPVVEIDGELIRGYDPARMQELLESS